MRRLAGIAAALLLAGCAPRAAPPPAAAPDEIGAGKVEEHSEVLDFDYAWPGPVSMNPGLFALIHQQLAADRAEASKAAEEDRKSRVADDIPFNPHAFSKNWGVAGETPRLLSLVAEIYTFQGGAHGNTGYQSLLWDKSAARPVDRDTLLPARLLSLLTPGYCAALDREREERRGEPVPASREGLFDDCPPLANQTLAPLDGDDDGRFDALAVLIAPYEAGPYVEGTYELQLPLDAAALAALPAAYRSEFEISRQPQ